MMCVAYIAYDRSIGIGLLLATVNGTDAHQTRRAAMHMSPAYPLCADTTHAATATAATAASAQPMGQMSPLHANLHSAASLSAGCWFAAGRMLRCSVLLLHWGEATRATTTAPTTVGSTGVIAI